jgi:LmbE family N-acetylglucosaminyl deacetylase
LFLEKNKIIVFAPHTDDGELGCGGTIAKLTEEKKDVYYVAFSSCSDSLPPEFPPDTLVKEVKKATKHLGIPENNLIILDFKVRNFSKHRQQILDTMIKLKKEIKPEMVFIPSLDDLHQDHSVIASEALRAFKQITVFCYEMPWNNISFKTNAFIKLDKRHIDKKIKALKEYKSQKHRNYLTPDFIKSLALTRGVQIGSEYAEVFEVIRLLY